MVNLDKQIAMEQIQQKLNFRQNNNHNHINNSYSTGSTGSSSLKSYSSSCSTASSSPDEREEVKLLNLDEFLKESGMDMDSYYEESEEARLQNQHQQKSDSNQESSSNNKNSNNFSPLDLAMATPSGAQFKFDPSFCRFTDDELRPQPMIHKSKKVSIPDGQKDIRYWARREKNNHAAKRSRDARRVKENQIVLRANFLEKENEKLRMEINRMKEENNQLKNFMNVRD